MKPQAAYSHQSIREIIEDVTQSSIMRLDPVSMNKLWDLISMVFKWQISISDDVIGITLRHLYEIENFITNPETHQQLQKVQNLIENFNKVLDENEKTSLHEGVTYWLTDYRVKVSLLLRMGLQTMDGNFVVNNLSPAAEEMLKNLGENIYQVTQNGRIMENFENSKETDNEPKSNTVNELDLFANELLGVRKLSSDNALKLSLGDANTSKSFDKEITFDNIDVNLGKLEDLIGDIYLNNSEDTCFEDNLLDLIGTEEEQL